MPVEDEYFADTGFKVNEFYIGVGLHSQHFYAQYGHIIFLRRDGMIIMAQPTEISPLYRNVTLRPPTEIDLSAYHDFKFTFTDFVLQIEIDDFVTQFNLGEMDKVLGPGLIRFQSFLNWMAISEIQIDEDVT
jgi:hypothetical protein